MLALAQYSCELRKKVNCLYEFEFEVLAWFGRAPMCSLDSLRYIKCLFCTVCIKYVFTHRLQCVKLRFTNTMRKLQLYPLKRYDDVLYAYYKKIYCSPHGRNLYDLVTKTTISVLQCLFSLFVCYSLSSSCLISLFLFSFISIIISTPLDLYLIRNEVWMGQGFFNKPLSIEQ